MSYMRYNSDDYDHIIDLPMNEWLQIGDTIGLRIRMSHRYFASLDLGIYAPDDVSIHRKELYDQIQKDKEK